jgi:hypothetical protein
MKAYITSGKCSAKNYKWVTKQELKELNADYYDKLKDILS